MKESYDFGFEKVKVSIGSKVEKKLDRYTGEEEEFVIASFTSESHPKPTKHWCKQEDPLEDVKSDVNLIKAGNISDTNFYKHWMKLFFQEGHTYALVRKEGINIKKVNGEFLGQDKYKENTFYFMVDGKKCRAKEFSFLYKEDRYKL